MLTKFIINLLLIIFLIVLVYIGYKQSQKGKNIAVFSGSFNPAHIGHKTIIEELSVIFDFVYVLVTPQNPLKENVLKDSLKLRIDTMKKALWEEEFLNVFVDDVENTLEPPYYTINTLNKLKEREPNNKFTLAIGADNLLNIKEWHDYQAILLNYGVIVFGRGNTNYVELEQVKEQLLKENPNYKIRINKTKVPNVSSTQIREMINNGQIVKHLLF